MPGPVASRSIDKKEMVFMGHPLLKNKIAGIGRGQPRADLGNRVATSLPEAIRGVLLYVRIVPVLTAI
jgi:hypothetical protein